MSKWCTHQKYTFSFCPFLEALISQFIVFSKKKTPFDVNILKSWIESRSSIHSLCSILSAYRECVLTSSATQLTLVWPENRWKFLRNTLRFFSTIIIHFIFKSKFTPFLYENRLVMISRYHNGLKINVKKKFGKIPHTCWSNTCALFILYIYKYIFNPTVSDILPQQIVIMI